MLVLILIGSAFIIEQLCYLTLMPYPFRHGLRIMHLHTEISCFNDWYAVSKISRKMRIVIHDTSSEVFIINRGILFFNHYCLFAAQATYKDSPTINIRIGFINVLLVSLSLFISLYPEPQMTLAVCVLGIIGYECYMFIRAFKDTINIFRQIKEERECLGQTREPKPDQGK